jgi:hypothetical protein
MQETCFNTKNEPQNKSIMKKNFYLSLTITLSTLLFFVACKKGDPGPAGAAGAAGAAGPAGPAGPKGDSTTAHVTYSTWLDVPFKADTVHPNPADLTIIDTLGYYANITVPKLTAAIITSGDIKVYCNLNTLANPDVVSLSYVDAVQYSTLVSITAEYLVGDIFLYASFDAGTKGSGATKVLQYRYVFIPGTTAAKVAPKTVWADYNQLAKFYDVPM